MSHATQKAEYRKMMQQKLAAFIKLLEERKVPMGEIDNDYFTIKWPNGLYVSFGSATINVNQTSSRGTSYGYRFDSPAQAAETVQLNVGLPERTPLPRWKLPQGMR